MPGRTILVSPQGGPGYTATPISSPPAGTYSSAQTVTISCATPGAAIYYTDDSSNPTFPITGTTQLYTGPITVSTSETIKAIAQASPRLVSAVGSAAYTISGGSALPAAPVTYLQPGSGSQPTNYSTPATRQLYSNYNFIKFASWPGIESSLTGSLTTMQGVMLDVKSRAAANGSTFCKTGYYNIPESLGTSGDPRTALFTLLTNNNWWLFAGGGAFPAGGKVSGDIGYITNQSNQTPLATSGFASGMNYMTAEAVYEWNYAVNGTPAAVGQSGTCAPNSAVDFNYGDNEFWAQRAGGQWLCTSTVYGTGENGGEPGGDTTVFPFLQAGYAQRITKWRSLAPSILQGGNCDQLGFGSPFNGVNVYTSSIVGLYDLPLAENLNGNSVPNLQFASPQQILARMVQFEQLLTTNPLAIPIFQFGEGGPAPGATWPASQTPSSWSATFTASSTSPTNSGGNHAQTGTYWQGARYCIAMALLRGWAMDPGAELGGPSGYYATPPWFDEFNKGAGLNAGGSNNWLGPMVSPKVTGNNTTDTANGTLLSNGVYKVVYTHGTVWFNPNGNGTQTITVSGHALPNGGYSDPSINNGAAFSTLTLLDADGRITLP